MIDRLPRLGPDVPEDLEFTPPLPSVLEDESDEMPLRVFAAIRLRVPDSGLPWLDEMIRESRRLDYRPFTTPR